MEALQDLMNNLGYEEIEINDIIVPGADRLSFQEQIIERIDPGILFDQELNLPGKTQLSRLLTIYTDYGIQTTIDIIQGTCQQSASINLIYTLLSLLQSNDNTMEELENHISYIANNPNIFLITMNLFPPTFPQKYPANANFLPDMMSILEYWKQEYKRLSLYSPEFQGKSLPNTADLKALRNSIEKFCKEVKEFRKNYEGCLREHMGEGVERNNLAIGKWSKACMSSYEKLQELFKNIESIWSSINILISH
ncbi:hypothetical protein SteCoe_25473 [Stentor coeruleus]|uniref:Uncharacterized protein n=1 Tax=Stentor coeruleus TaxID=5963 RepID=A0A1R2BF43_9CILI|nr:hypothetical protein SteCoe_25473 [Stentor coeruleus]